MEERLGEVSGALAAATQTAAQLPSSTDLDFYCSIDRGVQRSLADATERLGHVMRAMRSWIADGETEAGMDDAEQLAAPSTFTTAVGDLVDQLLERTDVYLDEYEGRRPIAAPEKSKAKAEAEAEEELLQSGPLPAHILNAQIPHPQRLFTTQPDNRADHKWSRPLRLGKPNAKVPLGWRDPRWDTAEGLIVGPYSVEGDPRLNPYHVEIYQTDVPKSVFDTPQPQAPEPLDVRRPTASTDRCPFAWVRTAAELDALKAHLAEDRVKEIAVDLEHHNKHSYLGIVCLMQVSTRYGDWIVDTLSDEVREHAEVLNEVFTDPAKILVLHGADHDILWLQRDLGVYVTCLFDTYHATNVLPFSVHSLAFLLQRYTEFEADKRFQLADWRIRPLPKEMLYYARSDTHSLLYIYDKLREELQQQGGQHAIREVFERSKATASKVYAKEPWDEQGDSRSGWHTLWLRHGGELARAAPQNKAVAQMGKEERMMRCLHRWRDTVAREEDEGAQYLLSISSLMHLVFRMPTTPEEVKRAVPAQAQAVRKRATELAQVIQEEIEAYNRDAQRRGADAQQQLTEMLGDASADDLGEAVPVPSAVAEARLAGGAPTVQTSLWARHEPMAVPRARLFHGMLTADGRGAISGGEKKRKSLFDLPEQKPSALTRIRGECAEVLRKVFGGHVGDGEKDANDSGDDEADDDEAGDDEADEAAHVQQTRKHTADATPTPSASASVDPSPHAALDDSEDEIVPVSKKARWSKDKKRQRKEAQSTVAPFDYSTATSVLDAKRAPPTSDLLASAPRKRKNKAQDTTMPKTAKRKSDVRSGNRSGTFAKKL